MSYISNNSYNNNKWYSVSSSSSFSTLDSDVGESLDDYCSFCLTNFRQYHQMVNNICQSCGRVAEPVMHDDQELLKASSNNAYNTDDSAFAGVVMDIDYSPIEENDPTRDTIYGSGHRMTATGATEAIKKINEVDRRQSKIVSAMLRNEKFIVKAKVEKDSKAVQFDSNPEDNLI